MIPLEQRYRGALIGLACGDALGGPVEFVDRTEMDRRFPGGLRDFIGGGWLDLAPGEITDDTQMTLDVARSLADHPEPDMHDLASRFVAWRDSGPKDIGNTTRDALDRLAAGESWEDAGLQTYRHRGPVASAGNGAIMRCAPIALRFRNDATMLRTVSIDVSRITHANPLCTWSSVALDQAIAALLNGAGIVAALDRAADGIEHEEVLDALAGVRTRPRDAVASGGFVLDTLTASLWSLHTTTSFEDAVVTAVGLGGDSDSTGAVTGALAGAHHGLDAIPARWRTQVQHRAELDSLAMRLLALS